MLERVQFTWKDKPYEVLSLAQTKIDEQWVESIVYIALYNNKDGEVWVKTAKDVEWKEFKETVYNSRERRTRMLQGRLELRATGRTTRMADAYIQELFEKRTVIIKDHYDERSQHERLFINIINRLEHEHRYVDFLADKTKLQITLKH